MSFIIREINGYTDAEKIWHLKRLLHDESEFLRLSSDEKKESVNDELTHIQLCKNNNRLVLGAYYSEKIIGYLSAFVDLQTRKIYKVTMGVLQEYQSKGVGRKLLKEMEKHALNAKINAIEMNVMTHNLRALHLYQKLGYKISDTSGSYQIYGSQKVVSDYLVKKKL